MPTEPKDKSKDVIDKEALDALNFRNNILAKLQGKKNRTNHSVTAAPLLEHY